MTYHIYTLKHPETLEIFYVGCTSQPIARERAHTLNYNRTKGFIPVFEVVEKIEGSASDAIAREWELIQEYSKSHNLQQDIKTRRPGNVRRRELWASSEKVQSFYLELEQERIASYKYYPFKVVAEKFNISVLRLRQMLEEKNIKPYQIGTRSYRLRTDQIEKLFVL